MIGHIAFIIVMVALYVLAGLSLYKTGYYTGKKEMLLVIKKFLETGKLEF